MARGQLKELFSGGWGKEKTSNQHATPLAPQQREIARKGENLSRCRQVLFLVLRATSIPFRGGSYPPAVDPLLGRDPRTNRLQLAGNAREYVQGSAKYCFIRLLVP